ncbi:MAG: RNA polymerase factor sigma-54, partial [Betaproteobacteria bacterium]|nr:RNA polymerase factor sigma-54 [Betaproteobacteria bacterium]
MKPTLQFRLSQHLRLTPQLQQSIRLLQLSTVELNQEIERLLMQNPILEREDGEADAPAGERARAPEQPGGEEPRAAGSEPGEARPEAEGMAQYSAAPWRDAEDGDDEGERGQGTAQMPTLREHLNSQLTLVHLGLRDRALVSMLIDALDDDGYLTQPLEEIAAMLPPGAEAGLE